MGPRHIVFHYFLLRRETAILYVCHLVNILIALHNGQETFACLATFWKGNV